MSPFMSLTERVSEIISRFRMFSREDRIGVAVSGGADSVCLLRALIELGYDVVALHVNHHLRGAESDEDERFVRTLAAAVVVHQAPLAESENIEAAARDARYAFFDNCMAQGLCTRVATAHTSDDQAETVLFRLLRGSGLTGLSGIHPINDSGIVRPMLTVERTAVELWLRERGIAWREDSSNSDLRFARNRLRHQLLPQLRREWNSSIDGCLAHLADVAWQEERFWSAPAPALPWVVDVRELNAVPRALARRMIRGALPGLDFRHVEQILALAADTEGHGRVQVPGGDVMRSFEWLRIAKPPVGPPQRNFSLPVEIPGQVELPEGGRVLFTFSHDVEDGPATESAYNEGSYLHLNQTESEAARSLVVRNWVPGDAYRPHGRADAVKVKELFQGAHVPLWERRNWPILSNGSRILWTRQFGPAAHEKKGALGCTVRITMIPSSPPSWKVNPFFESQRLKGTVVES